MKFLHNAALLITIMTPDSAAFVTTISSSSSSSSNCNVASKSKTRSSSIADSMVHRNYRKRRTTTSTSTSSSSTELNLTLFPVGGDAATSVSSSVSSVTSTILSSDIGDVPLVYSVALNAVLFLALKSKLNTMLTPSGFWHAFGLGCGLWWTLGWKGWTVCVMYLFLGQAVTKLRFKEKAAAGIAESRGGRRGPENVWGSAATGLLCAFAASNINGQVLSATGISSELFILGYVASLATKLSDTFASEIGKGYGKTTFLITNFKRVPPGTEGAISAEGTAAALVGGALLSAYALWINVISTFPQLCVASVAAFIATNVESLIGATLQEKEGFDWLSNEVVNFINTLIGAFIAVTGGKLLLGM